jgi:hypothetical protein
MELLSGLARDLRELHGRESPPIPIAQPSVQPAMAEQFARLQAELRRTQAELHRTQQDMHRLVQEIPEAIAYEVAHALSTRNGTSTGRMPT